MITPSSVVSRLELLLLVPGGPSLPVVADLGYDVTDPWAVRVAFHTGSGHPGGGTVEWLFARQLLTDGVSRAVGEGDVQVWPATADDEPVVQLSMASPSGSAVFEIDRGALITFLRATYLLVPTGQEIDGVDLDAELLLLLDPARD